MEIDNDMKMYCLACHGCQAPFQDGLKFDLPPGNYNVVYTDGTDTFEIQNIQNGYYFLFDVIVDMTLLCSLWRKLVVAKFILLLVHLPLLIILEKIPDYMLNYGCVPTILGTINLFNYLNGTPETGGTWSSENPPRSWR